MNTTEFSREIQTRFWALHFDICEMLSEGKQTFESLSRKLTGERLIALYYFHNHELTYL